MSSPAPESPRANSHDRRQNASGAGVCGRCKHPRRKGDRFCAHCGLQFEGALAERKFVTLLFADLCGSTAHVARADPEEAQVFLDRALRTMAEAVETYGGSVRRLQGDGLVGVFGAPIAQEDHALRACLAALAVHQNDFLLNLSLAALVLKRENPREHLWRVPTLLAKAEKQLSGAVRSQNALDLALTKSIYLALADKPEEARAALQAFAESGSAPPEVRELLRVLGR